MAETSNSLFHAKYSVVIGLALRKIRDRAGLDQGSVATLLGVNVSTMSRYESGSTSLTVAGLHKLLRALGGEVTITSFFVAMELVTNSLAKRGVAVVDDDFDQEGCIFLEGKSLTAIMVLDHPNL